MKKTLKILLWALGIVVALVLTLPLWIGPVAKTAANAIVPKKTGTPFNLGQFSLNPYGGRLTVGDVQLFNPQGFSQKMAVTLGALNVEVDVASLAGDPIVIREIAVKDVFVSYDMNGSGESNFSVIQRNAEGEKAKPTEKDAAPPSAPAPAKDEKSAKKVVIDRLSIQGALVQLGPIPMPMPNIELTGIGRKSNGVTMQEAWEQVSAQVTQNLNGLGVNVNDLLNNQGKVGLDQAIKAVGAVGDLSKKEGRRKAVKNLVDAFLGGADAVGGAAGQTTDTVGGGAKKASDAVGEQTDKAVNALKGLFK